MLIVFLRCLMLALVGAGIAYQLAGAWLAPNALTGAPNGASTGAPDVASRAGVTILKPLHGAEPKLLANVNSFAAQRYQGPVEIVFGIQRPDDPARSIVAQCGRLAATGTAVALVCDARRYGSNAKISNLANMAAAAYHDILIVSDSDMAVGPDYVAHVVAALEAPGVGAVSCLYYGRGDAGGWSRLAAMGISHGFLPSVIIGLSLGLANPCMGSTIAMRRTVLDRIGGFGAFAEVLADDYAIGAAVRGLGLSVAIPRMAIAHGCAETGFAALVRQELRWNVTLRQLDPLGFVGLGLVNPLPAALLAGLVLSVPAWLALVLAAVSARLLLALRIDAAIGQRTAPLWWLPARDLISFALHFGSLGVRNVHWRGARLALAPDGLIADRSK
jgi:ceramide glucosyltransferase